MKSLVYFLLFIPLLGSFMGCVPNLARTNARIEPGFDFGISGSLIHLDQGENINTGETSGRVTGMDLQFDTGLGFRADQNYGASGTLKLSTSATPSLDLYVELPSPEPWFYGVGAEFGPYGNVYASATHYFRKDYFLTLTTRYFFDGPLKDQDMVKLPSGGINPQLALGWASPGIADIGAFFGYSYFFGDGAVINWGFPSDDPPDRWLRHFLRVGMFVIF